MANAAHDQTSLTKNQKMVFETLAGADGPLSAYSVLDRLRDKGFRAPPQVYRALDKLIELGMVHRLESLNAFVVCGDPGCSEHKDTVAFTICSGCGQVEEISDDDLSDELSEIALRVGFTLQKSTIELRGLCSECGDRKPN